jgi:rhodanese-related sulfurtransferase
MVIQVRSTDFADWVAAQAETPVLLDVREPWELQTACIQPDGVKLLAMPMREIPNRLAELRPDQPVACLCHHGVRSLQVAHFLAHNGFQHVANVAGGIHAWSQEVDGSVAIY